LCSKIVIKGVIIQITHSEHNVSVLNGVSNRGKALLGIEMGT